VVCKCESADDLYENKKFTQKRKAFIYSREELRLQAKRKGLTTCLIRDAGI
jgi:hypothetical protein